MRIADPGPAAPDPGRGAPSGPDAVDPLTAGLGELRRRYAEALGAETVERHVQDALADLARAGTTGPHLEKMAVRFAASRLDALAEAEGLVDPQAPRVLFVCVQNAGRSQLAAALLAEHAGDAVRVLSAGSRPAAHVHGTVAPLLAEHGADPEETFPKPVTEEILRTADYVITMGCGDECEVHPHTVHRDWPVGDPAEADWDRLQEIVADIERRVAELWAEIQATLPR
ncbi:low molecular weight phosphatase family protein [Micrococcus antarcticus]|uniref:arsenate-mycothiol transferase ArsC n=1 Tax=Micrococcus antarcticus TaxID=86171 RepID=UPI00384B7A6C